MNQIFRRPTYLPLGYPKKYSQCYFVLPTILNSDETTETVIERKSKGNDGGKSEHIVEKDKNGNTVSKTHRVTKEGKVIHQHQDHVSTEKNKKQGILTVGTATITNPGWETGGSGSSGSGSDGSSKDGN